MTNLARYNTSDLGSLMKRINEYSIGMDEYFDKIFNLTDTNMNYPPYNLIQLNNNESVLEIALAGFKKDQVSVYTKDGRLYVEGRKEDNTNSEEVKYLHRGVAQRGFSRSWTISDDTEVKLVDFTDGLLSITLARVVPDHHKRKDYL